jgi:hypothetical protein
MTEEQFPSGENATEFKLVAPAQVERMAGLVDGLVDGSLRIVSRTYAPINKYITSDFFHHSLGRYNNATGSIDPISQEESREIVEHGNPFGLFDGKKGPNRFGFTVHLPHLGLHLDTYTALEEDDINCTIGREIFADEISRGPIHVTEDTAKTLLDMAHLLTQPDEGSAMSVEDQVKILDRTIQWEQPPGPKPKTVTAFKGRLLEILDVADVKAGFTRMFLGDEGKSIVGLQLTIDAGGNRTKTYSVEVDTPAPTEGGKFDKLVTVLRWQEGELPDYSQYTSPSITEIIEDKDETDPEFHEQGDVLGLVDAIQEDKGKQKFEFEREKLQGFHRFSEAEADRIIERLEDPGEEPE